MSIEKLIVALDVVTINEVKKIVKTLEEVKWYKVGSQLYTAIGPKIIEILKKSDKKIFLDLKYHDIPNVVAQSSLEALKLGVDMFDLHVLGGFEMMETAMKMIGLGSAELNVPKPVILGFTMLTSINEANLHDVFGTSKRSLGEELLMLAQLVSDAGLDGVVASAQEAKLIKSSIGKDFLVVTPGIRLNDTADFSDTVSLYSAEDAIKNGSDFIVMGRPIIRAKKPRVILKQVLDEIERGLAAIQ